MWLSEIEYFRKILELSGKEKKRVREIVSLEIEMVKTGYVRRVLVGLYVCKIIGKLG